MVLAVCGGSPGEKDKLEPGNGSTNNGAAAAAYKAKANGLITRTSPPASDEPGPGSAQANKVVAAEAALQVCVFVFSWWLSTERSSL